MKALWLACWLSLAIGCSEQVGEPHEDRSQRQPPLTKAREADDRERREKFNAEWRAVMEQLEGGCDIVGQELLEYPENWDEIAEK